jgi:hypothetical protein
VGVAARTCGERAARKASAENNATDGNAGLARRCSGDRRQHPQPRGPASIPVRLFMQAKPLLINGNLLTSITTRFRFYCNHKAKIN